MERHKGHFSKKLAAWAIQKMENRDATGQLRPINPYSLEEVEQMILPFRQEIGEDAIYDAWSASTRGYSGTDAAHVPLCG